MGKSMTSTKLSTKGQIVLPRSLREARQWRPGTEFLIEERPDGVLLKPHHDNHGRGRKWRDILGIAKYRGLPRTLREMDEAVLGEARKR